MKIFRFDPKSFFDYRDVYVMKRITKRSWYAKLTMQSEYKIGIAKNTKRRNATVNKAIKGKVVVMSMRTVFFAYKKEQRLHRLFADSRFRIRGGKGGGVTEWFHLNLFEYLILELWLLWYANRPYFFLGLFLLILLFKF